MWRHSSRSWLILGWIGLAFLIVGGMDFALAWIPPRFGVREWEFATVTQSFNGLPILLLGVGLLTVASEETDRRWWGLVGSAASAVLLLWVLLGAVIWAMSVSIALETAPENVAVTVRKAIAKTAVQAVVYIAAFALLLGRTRLRKPDGATERDV